MCNKNQYTYYVIWSPEDGEYVGLCEEFMLLSHLAKTKDQALEGIIALVQNVVDY